MHRGFIKSNDFPSGEDESSGGKSGGLDSAVRLFEVVHEVDEFLHAFHRNGVVDAGADAANGAVSLQADHAGRFRFLDELGFELFVREAEDDVHSGTAVGADRAVVIAFGGVDCAVQGGGLGVVDLFDRVDSADLLDPVGHQRKHIDAIGRRRVVEGVVGGIGFITEHGRDVCRRSGDHVLAEKLWQALESDSPDSDTLNQIYDFDPIEDAIERY